MIENDNEFAGDYESQYAKEFERIRAVIKHEVEGGVNILLNTVAAKVIAVVKEAGDDPIEDIKARALKNAVREALMQYTLAFNEMGISVAGKVPDKKVQKVLAHYAEKKLQQN